MSEGPIATLYPDGRVVEWDGRTSFLPSLPTFQIAWDSTSLGTLKECPRKYQLSIVEGWRGRGESLHLRWGQLYHRALEVYDHGIAEGMDHQDALRKCLRDLAEGCQDYSMEPCTACEGSGIQSFGPCTDCLGQGETPTARSWWVPDVSVFAKNSAAKYKTVDALFRTVIWYLERFGVNDPAQTITLQNGKPAVELSFRFDAGFSLLGTSMLYSGHFDRVVDLNEAVWGMDRKTTGNSLSDGSALRYFDQYSPDNQMSMYTFALNVSLAVPAMGMIIDAAQVAAGFSRFERGFALRTTAQLEEWHRDNQWWIGEAARFAQDNYWPMNDKSCDKYGGCPFRNICKKDPAVRYIYLESSFRIEKWDPLKVRGDI